MQKSAGTGAEQCSRRAFTPLQQHSHVPSGYHVLQLSQLTHTVPAAHTAPATGFRQGLSNSPQASQQQPRPLQGRLNFVVSPSNTYVHTDLRSSTADPVKPAPAVSYLFPSKQPGLQLGMNSFPHPISSHPLLLCYRVSSEACHQSKNPNIADQLALQIVPQTQP